MIINGIPVISNDLCVQTWRLNDWTKELMGKEWIDDFNKWAEYNLPEQPTCYMIQGNLVAHPSIIQDMLVMLVTAIKD